MSTPIPPTEQEEAVNRPHSWRLAYLLVALLSALVYLPSFQGLSIWDDHDLIGGPGIGGGDSLARCFTEPFLNHYFRPLVSVSFYLDHKLFGTGTCYYHQTNILIHVITTLLLMGLLRTAFSSQRIALLGGLLFAVQPTQVSTTAWVGGRTDSLCTLFLAGFGWAVIAAAQTTGWRRLRLLALSTLSFGAALLCKEQVLAGLPLVPLAFACFAPVGQKQDRWAGWKASLPYVLISLAFVFLWVTLYPQPFLPSKHRIVEQLALAGHTFTYFTLLLLAPTPRWMHTLSLGILERAGAWSIVAGYAIAIAVLILFRRWLRRAPGAAWLLAWTALILLPVSNLTPLPSLLVAPYRAGIAGLGIAGLLGWALVRWWEQTARKADGAPVRLSLVPALAGALLVVWCIGLTFWGAGRWTSEPELFATIVHYDPDSIIARANLASSLIHSNQATPAIASLEDVLTRVFGSQSWRSGEAAQRALVTDPHIMARVRQNQGNQIEAKEWLAQLYAQLGFAHLQRNEKNAAIAMFRIGTQMNPSSGDANLGLGCCAHLDGDDRMALRYLRRSLAGDPKKAAAHGLLGQILAAQGDWQSARTHFQYWAHYQPWIGAAFVNLAEAQEHLGDYAGARKSLEYALAHSICNPDRVRSQLAGLDRRQRRVPSG